jgi:phospholipid/cholesterol/gamma-HCH transport system substrate-binding protein
MMAAEKSYARLGLFVALAVAVIVATALFFVQRMRSREVIELVTYVTENVSGLDISSPVRFRGVPIGRVSALRVDPGHTTSGTTIEIDFEVFQDRLTSSGANVQRLQELASLPVFPDLRTRVVANPVTGDAYLLLDVPSDPPPPVQLGFTPDRPYVASMPSPLAVVQDRLPAVLERAEMTLETLREIVTRVPDSLDRSDRFFTNVERIIQETQLPQLSADSRAFFQATTAQMTQIANEIDRLAGTDSALVKLAEETRAALRNADVPRATQSVRDALDRTSLAADDFRRALPEIRDALEQLRELARRLEEQPESVVYGPRKPRSQ